MQPGANLSPSSMSSRSSRSSRSKKKVIVEEEKEPRSNSTAPAIFKKIIIHPEWKPVTFLNLLIILFSVLSTHFAAFFACFGEPQNKFIKGLDLVMEIFFIIDIVSHLFMMYRDPRDPRKYISDITKIIWHYLKGAFIFDLLAVLAWPISGAMKGAIDPENADLIYLLRLFRLSKILILMDLQKFT